MPFFERRVRKVVAKRGAKTRELMTRAGAIHVYDVPGNENAKIPTIVILHGIAASGTGFASVFMRLRKHAKRVIVPDYPGHGMSGEPSVRLTLDALLDAMTGALDELLGEDPVRPRRQLARRRSSPSITPRSARNAAAASCCSHPPARPRPRTSGTR